MYNVKQVKTQIPKFNYTLGANVHDVNAIPKHKSNIPFLLYHFIFLFIFFC